MISSIISEQWLHPDNYAFWSSQWGAATERIIGLIIFLLVLKLLWPRIWRHFECDVEEPDNCHRRGHPVPGTGHKACGEHNPHRHDREKSPTTAADILKTHEESNS